MSIRYHPGDTLLHRLDPRVKITGLLLLTVVVFVVQNHYVVGAMFLTTAGLWYGSGLPLRVLAGYYRYFASMFILLVVLQGLFYGGQTVILKPVIPTAVPFLGGLGSITLEGITFGALLGIRLAVLVTLLPLLLMTTPVYAFGLGLVRMGMPYKIAYTATTALNIIPSLEDEARSIMDAQRLRGFQVFEKGGLWSKMKAYPTLVVPLVIGAMRRAQLMGVAMDVRAFGSCSVRTYVDEIKMGSRDWSALTLVVLYSGLLLAANFRW